jgi:Bacterial cadherin-like domain
MRSLTFTIEGAVDTVITVTEREDGSLKFDIVLVSNTEEVGDLRALFFDLSDVSPLGTLRVTGDDVTEQKIQEDGVTTLGRDANINGAVLRDYGRFDVGVEFGTPGTGKDDIQSTSFMLSSGSGPLSLDLINLQDFGVRVTSVGDLDGPRKGGLKAGSTATAAPDALDDLFATDEDTVPAGWNVLGNDTDLDGDVLVVAAVQGEASKVGQPVTVLSKAGIETTVTILANGDVVFDPTTEFGDLRLGRGRRDHAHL